MSTKSLLKKTALSPASKTDHRYILVAEDGTIETITCKRVSSVEDHDNEEGTILQVMDHYHLNGYHRLSNGVMIHWSDEGSLNGSKPNAPVSKLLRFTAYGPCMFARDKRYSDGLTEAQYDEIMHGLKAAPPVDHEAIVRHSVPHLQRMTVAQFEKIPLDLFMQVERDTGFLYGFIRQLSNPEERQAAVKIVNDVRNCMRTAIAKRNDPTHIIIGYHSEECE